VNREQKRQAREEAEEAAAQAAAARSGLYSLVVIAGVVCVDKSGIVVQNWTSNWILLWKMWSWKNTLCMCLRIGLRRHRLRHAISTH
jgi:hypothetical protein